MESGQIVFMCVTHLRAYSNLAQTMGDFSHLKLPLEIHLLNLSRWNKNDYLSSHLYIGQRGLPI